jgi:hypothetical protein
VTVRRAAIAAVLVVALLAPAAASAKRDQVTMMEDSAQLLTRGAAARDAALDKMKALGTDIVKVRVIWREIAPDADNRRRPDFDASNPAAYPAHAWDELDAAVSGILARGMKPFLMVGPAAPEWATTGETRKYTGVWKVDPVQFSQFMHAIGRHYAGDTGGAPRVSIWSIWNEPNHPQFIQPLSERIGGKTVPSAPHWYRKLYVAATGALAATGHGADTVLFGEVLPIGQRRMGTLNTIRPLLWLREFFCVDSRYRPYRGTAARARGCEAFPAIVTSGFAMHPYTKPVGPRFPLASPDDATIGQIARVERALDAIARTKRVRKGLPIYSTEFGVRTTPPDCIGHGATLDSHAAIINEAEYDSYVSGRVQTFSQYLLIDDPVLTGFAPGSNDRYGRYQTGLLWGENAVKCESPSFHFKYGTPKQPSFDAFQTPLYVRKLKGGAQVFGRARPRGGEPQSIEILHGGRVVKTVAARGYFLTSMRGNPSGKWQLRWTFAGATYKSRVANALADPSRASR